MRPKPVVGVGLKMFDMFCFKYDPPTVLSAASKSLYLGISGAPSIGLPNASVCDRVPKNPSGNNALVPAAATPEIAPVFNAVSRSFPFNSADVNPVAAPLTPALIGSGVPSGKIPPIAPLTALPTPPAKAP